MALAYAQKGQRLACFLNRKSASSWQLALKGFHCRISSCNTPMRRRPEPFSCTRAGPSKSGIAMSLFKLCSIRPSQRAYEGRSQALRQRVGRE